MSNGAWPPIVADTSRASLASGSDSGLMTSATRWRWKACEVLWRAWTAGAGPGDGRLVVDVDCFVGEVFRDRVDRRANGRLQPNPDRELPAGPVQAGEDLLVADELIARVNRAGATGPKLLRADSGPNTASTHRSRSRSATSKTRRSRTSHPGTSSPTPPGRSSPRSCTTCCARPRRSGSPTPRSAPRPRSAVDCSRYPGVLVRSARRRTLRMPVRWPWANDLLRTLATLRALPPPA